MKDSILPLWIVTSLNFHWDLLEDITCLSDLLEDIACLSDFPCNSGITFSKFFDEFSCFSVPYASCFYCNRCEQVDLQDALVLLSLGDGWLVCCMSDVCGCCWQMWLCTGVRHCHIPCHTFTLLPRYKRDTLWTLFNTSGSRPGGSFAAGILALCIALQMMSLTM